MRTESELAEAESELARKTAEIGTWRWGVSTIAALKPGEALFNALAFTLLPLVLVLMCLMAGGICLLAGLFKLGYLGAKCGYLGLVRSYLLLKVRLLTGEKIKPLGEDADAGGESKEIFNPEAETHADTVNVTSSSRKL